MTTRLCEWAGGQEAFDRSMRGYYGQGDASVGVLHGESRTACG